MTLVWHTPRIVEVKTSALIANGITVGERKRTPRERELNRTRVARCYRRKANQQAVAAVVYDGDALNKLVLFGYLQEDEVDDPKEVSRAISVMLAEAKK